MINKHKATPLRKTNQIFSFQLTTVIEGQMIKGKSQIGYAPTKKLRASLSNKYANLKF